MTQTDLIHGIITLLVQDNPKLEMVPRQFNAIIKAADLILDELRQPERVVKSNMGLSAWLESDQVGLSSKYMALVLTGRSMKNVPYNYPRDASDFDRCLGLIEACPELADRVMEMAAAGPEWAALVADWHQLAALVKVGEFGLVSERIAALTGKS